MLSGKLNRTRRDPRQGSGVLAALWHGDRPQDLPNIAVSRVQSARIDAKLDLARH